MRSKENATVPAKGEALAEGWQLSFLAFYWRKRLLKLKENYFFSVSVLCHNLILQEKMQGEKAKIAFFPSVSNNTEGEAQVRKNSRHLSREKCLNGEILLWQQGFSSLK